jgi:hypothetical protein
MDAHLPQHAALLSVACWAASSSSKHMGQLLALEAALLMSVVAVAR